MGSRAVLRTLILPIFVLPTLTGCRLGDLFSPSSSSDGAALLVEPSVVADSAVAGSGEVRRATLSLRADGDESTAWSASVLGRSSWLVLDVRNGSIPGSLSLELHSDGLGAGRHRDTIVVDLDGDGLEPVRVPVLFTVGDPDTPPEDSDPPPDDPEPPSTPDDLAQYESDGATGIGVGGTTDGTSVVLEATMSDPDADARIRLQVEVAVVAVLFTGLITEESAAVSRGETASVTVSGLIPAGLYHWRARAVDETGRASDWVSFGGNGEIAADFMVPLL